MPAKNKPYEQFGSYILFKRLEADALGDLHRAARIDEDSLGPVVALRRLSGGNREALAAAAQTAQQIVPSLTGPTFVRDQRIEVIQGIATIVHDYGSGRSLRAIIDRARGGAGTTPNPLPLDQAIVIAERVALSLATTAELRFAGERIVHGALVPQFIWIGEDGEIRVAGQGLGHGLAASLREEKVAAEFGRYLAPETHHSGVTSKSTEVYALGAILYLLVTGQEPPDATRTSAFTYAIRATKTMAGMSMPDDIRAIIEKSLNIDSSSRYDSPSDMRAALSALSASGKYAATSFNLAFYLSTLLKKEMEAEAAERERESKTNVAAYAVPPLPVAAAPLAVPVTPRQKRNPLALAVAATLVIAAVGAGAWFALTPKPTVAQQSAHAPSVATVMPAGATQTVAEPIVATPAAAATATSANADAAGGDEVARKKAFEEAVKKRLQEEMLKLQNEHTRQLQQQQSRNAPVLPSPPPVAQSLQRSSAVEERVPSAAQLDQRREATRELPAPAPAQTATASAPVPTMTAASVVPPPAAAPESAPPRPQLREGDVVDMNDLDRVPTALREPRPVYPPIAARQRIEATVMATLLISETGDVIDVKILRGDARFGFNDAAIRAFRGARYTPPMKDGKRVKTWVAQMIQFKP